MCVRNRERESAMVTAGSVFQVYLEARKEEQQRHQENLNMLSEEVSHIQEVRPLQADTPCFSSLFPPAIICMADMRVSLSFSVCAPVDAAHICIFKAFTARM